eukprot:678157-Rhodomonas_salina.3
MTTVQTATTNPRTVPDLTTISTNGEGFLYCKFVPAIGQGLLLQAPLTASQSLAFKFTHAPCPLLCLRSVRRNSSLLSALLSVDHNRTHIPLTSTQV